MRIWFLIFPIFLVLFIVSCGGKEEGVKDFSIDSATKNKDQVEELDEPPNENSSKKIPTLENQEIDVVDVLGESKTCGEKPERVTDPDIIKASIFAVCSLDGSLGITRPLIDSVKVVTLLSDEEFGSVEVIIVEFDEWGCPHKNLGKLNLTKNINGEWENSNVQFEEGIFDSREVSDCISKVNENQKPKVEVIVDDPTVLTVPNGSEAYFAVRIRLVNFNREQDSISFMVELPDGSTAKVNTVGPEDLEGIVKTEAGYQYLYNMLDFTSEEVKTKQVKVIAYMINEKEWIKINK